MHLANNKILTIDELLKNITEVSVNFSQIRYERQTRRSLHLEDFEKIKESGYL